MKPLDGIGLWWTVIVVAVVVIFIIDFLAYAFFRIARSIRGYLRDYRADRPIGSSEKESH